MLTHRTVATTEDSEVMYLGACRGFSNVLLGVIQVLGSFEKTWKPFIEYLNYYPDDNR